MTTPNRLRLVSVGRKSRKGDQGTQFDRQDTRNIERAERDGHAIIRTTHDVVSSQTMPWQRKNLKEWMTDAAKLASYDGILVETDRVARCDDEGWHDIEGWCFDHDKRSSQLRVPSSHHVTTLTVISGLGLSVGREPTGKMSGTSTRKPVKSSRRTVALSDGHRTGIG
jgi:hypothetical protein